MSEHSNAMVLQGSMISSIEYVNNSVVITSGQSYSGAPSIQQDGDKWKITLEAGRKKSSSVANNFINFCGPASNEYCENTTGEPKELNFYFKVNIVIQVNGAYYPVNGIALGQGSNASIENWWIGGANIVNNGRASLVVVSGSTVVESLSLSGNGDSTFVFKPFS